MLLRDKMIFITVICLLIALDISVLYFVKSSEKFILDNEYSAAEREQAFIYNDVSRILSNAAGNGTADEKLVESMISSYNMFYEKYGTNLKIRTYGQSDDFSGDITIISRLNMPFEDKELVYTKKLDGIRQLRRQWREIFVGINLFVVSAAAFFAGILSYRATKPLAELTNKIRLMGGGCYDISLDVKRRDETGIIAEEFNKMAEAVRDNILKLNEELAHRETLAEEMAHELKNPLTVIGGFGEYLLKGSMSENDRIKACEYICAESKRLNGLCVKMLDLSLRNENIKKENIKTSELFEEIQNIVNLGNVTLELQNETEFIFADKLLLISMLTNLIDNAKNAGADMIKLEISEESIIVCDNGRGISSDNLENVFKPFFREDKSRSRENGGSGLGLALVRKIAELHGWNIKAESCGGTRIICEVK